MYVIPDFTADGFLPEGVWRTSGKEFLDRFLNTSARRAFRDSIVSIIDFAAQHHAVSVLVGGSFVSAKKDPADLDCVILFKTAAHIPLKRESVEIEGKSIDVFFASQDRQPVVRSLLRLFTENKFDEAVGAVEIIIRENDELVWDIQWEVDDDLFEIIKRAYVSRRFVDKISTHKALVTIHGLKSHAEWNSEVALIASANGWMVAPFHYGYTTTEVLLRAKARSTIVDKFRDFLTNLQSFGVQHTSIVAHSFGTYVACKYLLGFDRPPTVVDTLILTGAIIDEKLDINRFANKAACIVNEVAPNDRWVPWAKRINLGRDPLFGSAGVHGFKSRPRRLIQHKCDVFTHTNVIRRDVVAQRWMPILEANVGAVWRENFKSLTTKA